MFETYCSEHSHDYQPKQAKKKKKNLNVTLRKWQSFVTGGYIQNVYLTIELNYIHVHRPPQGHFNKYGNIYQMYM